MGYFGEKLSSCTSNRFVKRLLTPGDRLSERVVHAGFWAFALRIADRSLGLIRTIVLARLLAPEDFGLFGIAMLALTALETFSETGFSAALIQRQGDIRPYLDTAWTVQAMRGFLLAAILLIIAPFVAEFFGEPGAEPLVQALALYQVLSGLVNTGVLYFRKELEFHKEFVYMFSGTLVNFMVAIPAALILRNAWALVFGLIAGQLMRLVVSYLVHPYRPRPRLEMSKTKELHTFGRWVFGSSILVFTLNNLDTLLVGKLLGSTALGFYNMAYMFSNLSATEITLVINQIMFPTYSKLQTQFFQLKHSFFLTLQITSFFAFPIAACIFLFTSDFVRIILGEKWMLMVPTMQILAAYGLIRSLEAATSPVWMAIGKPYFPTVFNFVKLLILAILIYPFAILWGMEGIAFAVVLASVFVYFARYFKLAGSLSCSVLDLVRPIFAPLAASLTSIFIFYLSSKYWYGGNLETFMCVAVLFLLVYGTCTLVFEKLLHETHWITLMRNKLR